MNKYSNEFLKLTCGQDLLNTGLFMFEPQLTKSVGAFHAARNHLKDFDLKDPSVKIYCVGDGVYPRTGVIFAFRSKWSVVSIDPLMKPMGGRVLIERIQSRRCKVEDFHEHTEQAIIVLVHSHAPMSACLKSITATKRAVIRIPCCGSNNRPSHNPDIEYTDPHIVSANNAVQIWRNT